MASKKPAKPIKTDPATGQRYVIKDNGQRMRIPTPPSVWRPKFLAALADSANVRFACEEAGIERQVAYRAREEDADFAAAWRTALDDATDLLEAVARNRAVNGSDRMLAFLLAAHRPEVYGRAALQSSGVNPDAPSVHIYLPDNGRTGQPEQLPPGPETIEVNPERVAHPAESLSLPPDTNSETRAWLEQQPWYRGNKQP